MNIKKPVLKYNDDDLDLNFECDITNENPSFSAMDQQINDMKRDIEEYDKDIRLAIERAMEKLKIRELQILRDRFLIGKTQMEIASELGISQAQISRIEKNAITNIKKLIK